MNQKRIIGFCLRGTTSKASPGYLWRLAGYFSYLHID
jgi:hypothetical protein